METLAAAQGVDMHTSSADVIRGRALRHYSEGLKQYLAIRLRDLDTAADVMAALRQEVISWPAHKLLEPPSPRALLYQAARRLAQQQELRQGSGARSVLPWRPLKPEAPSAYVRAIKELRLTLPELDAELLELRYARELRLEEVAFVCDADGSSVAEQLFEAERRARAIVGQSPPSQLPGLGGAVVEAFALRAEAVDFDHQEGDVPPLPPGTLLGKRFVVEERVGVGAFSDVYRARDSAVPGHTVALKLLHQPSLSEAARESALRELRLIASVFHPSVVHFKDHGWFEERLWFVMPWYEGESLETRINEEPLTPALARKIFEPLANALATLHAAGIRHQDIKPDNIFLAHIRRFGFGEGEDNILPVLIDLGVAAREAEVLVAGTPMYFAPEVAARFASIKDAPPITHKADVFALALSLRNALEPSTQEDVPASAVDAFIEHRTRQQPSPPQHKKLRYMEESFSRWMSLDPVERPTAEQFAQELSILTRPEEQRARRRATVRRLGPLATTVLILFMAVVYGLWKRNEVQKLEALRARSETEDVRAVLSVESARRKALEEGNEDLMRKYEKSRLNRHQLVSKLATTERQVDLLGESLSGSRRRRAKLEDELGATQKDLSAATASLAKESARATQLTTALTKSEAEAVRIAQELSAARTAGSQIERKVEEITKDLTAAGSRNFELEQELDAARTGRKQLEQEVAMLRARQAVLEDQLAASRRSAGSGE